MGYIHIYHRLKKTMDHICLYSLGSLFIVQNLHKTCSCSYHRKKRLRILRISLSTSLKVAELKRFILLLTCKHKTWFRFLKKGKWKTARQLMSWKCRRQTISITESHRADMWDRENYAACRLGSVDYFGKPQSVLTGLRWLVETALYSYCCEPNHLGAHLHFYTQCSSVQLNEQRGQVNYDYKVTLDVIGLFIVKIAHDTFYKHARMRIHIHTNKTHDKQ